MSALRPTLFLSAVLLLAGAAAACGPSNPNPEVPPTPTGTPTAGPEVPTATPTATPTAAPTAAPSATSDTGKGVPPAANASQPLIASAMLADLKKDGIDLTKPLEKLSLDKKKKVMPYMQKALGYADCNGCHKGTDYKAETRNKKISRAMWKEFTAALRDDKGGAVFCDSCHAGKAKVLDRSDGKAMKAFMQANYVDKLQKADKSASECTGCHGDSMELKIIDKLWAIPKE